MQKKALEIPLDRNLLYHGLGKEFGEDTNSITATFEYNHGFRVGRKIEFGPAGDTTEIHWYTQGRFDSSLKIQDGARVITKAKDRSAWRRFKSWVVWKSQPRASNHKYFD